MYFYTELQKYQFNWCMDLQPAVQQLLHEPSLQEGNLREVGELDADKWEWV